MGAVTTIRRIKISRRVNRAGPQGPPLLRGLWKEVEPVKVIELLRTLSGDENTEIMVYPNGGRLYSGTSKNIPAGLLERQIVNVRLLPQTYLGITLYVA